MNTEESTTRSSRGAYWACQLLGWGLLQLAIITEFRAGGIAWKQTFGEALCAIASGVSITHLFRWFSRRQGWWSQLDARALLPRAIAASLVLASLHVGFGTVIELGYFQSQTGTIALTLILATLRWSMAFFVWICLYGGAIFLRERVESQRRRAELEKLLQASELRTLKAQINPHFLFNALNSVRALIAFDPSGAQTAVTQLARMLRYALSAGTLDFVPFEQELGMVDDYLGIESLRLGDRLRVEMEIGPSLGPFRIPVMTLQILVENAIKHGIAEIPRGGTLRVVASHSDGMLLLTVENPRPRVRRDAPPGIGVANATARLGLLCGPEASLSLDLSNPDRAIARACIPQAGGGI